ncbi:glycosyltransferase family 4 protein [Fibrella aquatilis]|uniref:Glycosyltransferase family 4 protein n=1 Tax=Fibrella aquatilis TaxID=2817059 RepID=A0A939JXA5_9BACT|nr:glycosyltransferase family 4 protein [Fibrella aquatilis]MBO0932737.1 glycosyltransferase family 4 protein [Fibrella aquatilis]
MHPHCMLAGGATTVLLEVSKRLVLTGWPVYVVSIQSNPVIVREAAAAGVRFVDVGGPLSSSIWFWVQYPLMYWRVHRAARQIGSPVVVSEPFPANWWGWFYKKLHPAVQLVYVCHEPTAFIFEHAWINSIKPDYMRWGLKLLNPIFRRIEHALMPVTDRVVANSQYSERTIAQTFPRLDPARLRLVYCGIDHEAFYPRPEMARNRQIVMVCTLNKFKRVDTVVRALALLRAQPGCGDIELKIKGRGVEKERLLQLANSLQLADAVTIIDAFYDTSQLANLLCTSQVFVHSAHNEPFGLSPIEAMACGTPAVVTGTGGTAETVTNEVSGLYFAYDSDESLARQLQRLFTDDTLWHRLSAGAIHHAAQFNWALTHEVFSGVLEEVSGL